MKKYSKGIGQYDLEYANCSCFWGKEPGKFVKLISQIISSGNVLDIGAGEGKNSVYLAQLGFDVTAIEVSKYAINNFHRIKETLEKDVRDKIEILEQDILFYDSSIKYDVIIAYGLLHCLRSLEQVDIVISKIRKWVKTNGFVIIVSFNSELGVPSVQDYLEPTLLPKNYLETAFSDFEIIHFENGIITESHPTTKIEHQHSLTRIIAKNISKI
jgi:cyclopropane fatty-acyl-phospholipid synthase-like methyltransferase